MVVRAVRYALLILTAALPALANAQTGMPYNPDNQNIEYQFCVARENYNPISLEITLNWQTFDHYLLMKEATLDNSYFGANPLFQSYPDGDIGELARRGLC